MNTILFDLDGTLLPMPDQQLFLDTYFGALGEKVAREGMEPKQFIKAVWTGTKAMLENDGTMTNERRYWKVFCSLLGDEALDLEPLFDHFYQNEFSLAKDTTFCHPHAGECIRILREKGYQLVLATNPLFPKVATRTRVEWAGLNPEDFIHITTYENSSFCKPNIEYYKEILKKIGKEPNECMMVGNDVKEDMCAAKLGMDTYLLKECLICQEERDIINLQQGDFDDLLKFIKELPQL